MMKNLSNLIIIVLVAIILLSQLRQCGGGFGSAPQADTLYVTDTVWQRYDSVVYRKVPLKEVIHDTLPPEYYPDPMYDSLKVQYQELAQAYLDRNIYVDTLQVPAIKGQFIVHDTVKNNKLFGRSWTADFIIPTVKETVTIIQPVKPSNQLYIGGMVTAEKTGFQNISAGLLLKTKKDRIVGVQVGYSGQINFGVSSYWKINLNR